MNKFGVVKRVPDVTVDSLRAAFPNKRETITQELADVINEAQTNPDGAIDNFLGTLIEYKGAMEKCSSSMKEYVRAVKFCAYLEAEDYNAIEAFKKARSGDKFVQDRLDAPTDSIKYKELASAASRFHRSALVKQILLQSDMPLYLLFQGARYKAVAVLMDEMENAAYSKDRITAAKELLANVKPPENSKVELEIGVSAETKSMQQSLEEQLAKVTEMQMKRLEAGEDIRSIQKLGVKTDIIDAEVE